MQSQHSKEIAEGSRFRFGKNWSRFLAMVDEQRIKQAEASLLENLECHDLSGLAFLDAGCGSGLFSLAARRLGARVHSFDFDPESVACAMELRRRYLKDDPMWKIEEGSVLDLPYLRSLGDFDIVYSWGVLHHTGAMWQALDNVASNVADGGRLFISIYHDQGRASDRWRAIKRLYCKSPTPLKGGIVLAVGGFFWMRAAVGRLTLSRPLAVKAPQRGMSRWYNLVDWVGGYPFEVATPEKIFAFFRSRGFSLTALQTTNGNHGCNEFVFLRETEAAARSGRLVGK